MGWAQLALQAKDSGERKEGKESYCTVINANSVRLKDIARLNTRLTKLGNSNANGIPFDKIHRPRNCICFNDACVVLIT